MHSAPCWPFAAAFIIGRSQHASAIRRENAAKEQRHELTARQCVAFGSNLIESIAELQRGCEYKNKEMVGRQEARLQDLVLFAQSISLAEVPADAVFAFLTLRGAAAEAAADAHSALQGWPTMTTLMPRFDLLTKKANETYVALRAALAADDLPSEALAEKRHSQYDDRKGPRSIAA